MARYFTVDEATALLPRVERHLRDALFAHGEYREADEAFETVRVDIQMAGGSVVNREKVTQIVAKRSASAVILQQEMDSLEDIGVQVKDLQTGLIDFPSIYHEEEVLLCWQFGEERIEHWHGRTEGYKGRKKIDAEFLAGHSGEREH